MPLSNNTLAKKDAANDRKKVDQLLRKLHKIEWKPDGHVAALVETPEPHRHILSDSVNVIEGRGFSRDHSRKSFFRGEYVPGREVSAITVEVLDILGVKPVVVGDNLITEGIDLGLLQEGDVIRVGQVELQRSANAHRPCTTFRARTSPEAFAAVRRERYRGALFNVRRGGTIRRGDAIVLLPSPPAA